jgi:hypothetical protein
MAQFFDSVTGQKESTACDQEWATAGWPWLSWQEMNLGKRSCKRFSA